MATLTIKIDSEELAREVLTHLNYLPEDPMPDLISVHDEEYTAEEHLKKLVSAFPDASERVKFVKSVQMDDDADEDMRQAASKMLEVIDEDPVQKKELTNEEVFAFIRSKGMTLESACKSDPEFGDFIASFTTAPEKRINGDIEPADLTSLGTDIADLDNPEDRFNVENSFHAEHGKELALIEMNKEDLRKKIAELNHVTPYDYLMNVSKHDQSLIVREAARALLIGMPKPEPKPLDNIAYDSDSDGDEEIRKLARERAKPIAVTVKDLGISESCLRNWMSHADSMRAAGKAGVRTSSRNWSACGVRSGSSRWKSSC